MKFNVMQVNITNLFRSVHNSTDENPVVNASLQPFVREPVIHISTAEMERVRNIALWEFGRYVRCFRIRCFSITIRQKLKTEPKVMHYSHIRVSNCEMGKLIFCCSPHYQSI